MFKKTLGWLAVVGWMLGALNMALASEPVANKAAKWIAGEKLVAERGVLEQEQREFDAKQAIAKAEHALSLSREYKDTEAEGIAQQALTTAQQALALARRHLTEQKQRAANLKIILERIPSDARTEVVGLPLSVRGDVQVRSGAKFVPMDPTYVLQPGDEVSVGDKGYVQLSLSDGHRVDIGSSTVYSIEKHTRQTSDGSITQYLHNLIKGVERVHGTRRGEGGVRGSIDDEHLYKAAAAVAAVRGTDFQMAVGADGLGHVSLFDGRIELNADTDAKPREHLKPWWLTTDVPAYAAPAAGAVARIAALRGAASIINKDKQSRPAKVGDSMAAGERVETGANTTIHLDIARGQRIALDSGARFTSVSDTSSKATLYALGLGRARVWGAGDKQSSQFLTPNTVAESHAREFEVNVATNGVAEYTPIEGSLDLSAVGKKLDWSKVDAWWDK